ncbi:MAG: hypothetical protein ACRDCE_22875 [Cetobacterium sp.]|uniref:hypothetical protein n=1 Tax=Cetobacterium sp. TaxID=2071632 RepID=UPI003EE6DE50
MKYIQMLEEYALAVPGFPYADLEVDYVDEGGKVVVSLYWTGDDGHTVAKDFASMPTHDFKQWCYSDSCIRTVKHEVFKVFNERAIAYPFRTKTVSQEVTTELMIE